MVARPNDELRRRAAAYAAVANKERGRRHLLARVARADAGKRSCLGIAYPAWDPPAPEVGTVTVEEVLRYVDSHGTFMRAETVDQLMRSFMANGRTMDVDHNRRSGAAFPVQSYIVRSGDPAFPQFEGAWAVEATVVGDEVWSRVERGLRGEPGGLNGYSIDVFSAFRSVKVAVEGIGVLEFGEFINPEPVFLSLVEFPSIGEVFESVRSAGDTHVWRSDMNPDTAPAPAQDSDETVLAKLVGIFRRDPARVERQLGLASVRRSVAQVFERIEPGWTFAALIEALQWAMWEEVFYNSALDAQGKREAIVQAFLDAAEIARQKFTDTTIVEEAQRSSEPALDYALGLLARASRAGKKISKARLEKIVAARDALQQVIDETSDDSSGESSETIETNRTRPPLSEGGVPQPQEEDSVKEAAAILEAIQAVRSDNAELRRQIDSLRAERENTPPEPENTPKPEPTAEEKILAEMQAMRSETTALRSQIEALRGAPATRRGGEVDTHGSSSQQRATFKCGDVEFESDQWGML